MNKSHLSFNDKTKHPQEGWDRDQDKHFGSKNLCREGKRLLTFDPVRPHAWETILRKLSGDQREES